MAEKHVSGESPWILGSTGLLVALAGYWIAGVLLAVQHAPGMTGQERVLHLLAPGDFAWAAGAILALALHSAGRRFELAPSNPSAFREKLPALLLTACLASALCAVLDAVVELANLGHGIDRALAGLVAYLAVSVLAGLAAWWAHREFEHTRPPQDGAARPSGSVLEP
jgi:hypothetical protein